MNGLVAWFVRNSVAANLLLGLLFVGGILSFSTVIRREAFPELEPEIITVSVAYPGATPEEVEESICVKIEEAVQSVDDVDTITSTAREGLGTVQIEIRDGTDIRVVLDDVKVQVDAIDTFPEDAEEPILAEQKSEERVISLVVSGDTSEDNLRRLVDEIRDELLSEPGITKVEYVDARPYEISIEVEEMTLRRYRLTFDDVANAVRRYSLNLPAGSVETAAGEVVFRSDAQAYTQREFENLPIVTLPDGTRITIGDVGTVIEGFEDIDLESRFDGDRALGLQIFRVSDQNTPEVVAAALDYVERKKPAIPPGITLETWQDESQELQARLDLLRRNGIQGLILVFIGLALFLKAGLAWWVAVGLTSAIFGAIWVLPWLDVSINFLSTFGFILVLGILVDDAIVVGENIQAHRDMGKKPMRAAIDGVREVMIPVSLAVMTTGLAFSPMLQLPGRTGKFASTIATVVIVAIFFSLVESLLILPCHLAHAPRDDSRRGLIGRVRRVLAAPLRVLAYPYEAVQTRVSASLEYAIERGYKPTLEFVIRERVLTLAAGLAFLIVTFALFPAGLIKVSFFPPIEGNNVIAAVTLPEGSSDAATRRALTLLERTAEDVAREAASEEGQEVVRHVRATLGRQPGTAASGPPNSNGGSKEQGNIGEVHLELLPAETRSTAASTLARRWRERVGDGIPSATDLTFSSDRINTGAPINIELAGPNVTELEEAAEELKTKLAELPGTFDITDDFRDGKTELLLEVTPSGAALGLTQQEIARQVRQGFYGEEAQRVQIGKDEVKVFVRYPEVERQSISNLDSMRIRLQSGDEVPFEEVATYRSVRGPATIKRIDRRRTIVVTADVDRGTANANELVSDLKAGFLPQLQARFPGLRYSFGGEQEQQAESFSSLFAGMGLALFLMFGLLGVVFRSYFQPLIVLSAIPFGVAGAVWAHYLLGMNLTFLSMIGILALMGVVVNDSLVLIDFINRFRFQEKMSLLEAIRAAGPRRVRPIALTSLTTFAGLTPILLEKSIQAAFVIPMAVSLAFGVAFATFVILVIVPAAYLVLEDILQFVAGGEHLDSDEEETSADDDSLAASPAGGSF